MKPIHTSLLLSDFLVPIRRMIYVTVGLLDQFFHRSTPSLFILCYHSAANDGGRFSMDADTIHQQLTLLSKSHMPVSLSEAVEFLRGERTLERPAFAVTFDDGFESLMNLKQMCGGLGIRPTVFALAHPEAVNRKELISEESFLHPSQLQELHAAGWEIGCHSATHTSFRSLSKDQLQYEIVNAKASLEQQIGLPISFFAYPKGFYTSAIKSVVRNAGFLAAFTMDDGLCIPGLDMLAVPRIGVDKTHAMSEFQFLWSPTLIAFRNFVKHSLSL